MISGKLVHRAFLVAVLLCGFTFTSWAQMNTGELCEVAKKMPLPEGVSEMGYSMEEGSCVYRYQFGQEPGQIIQFYEKALPEQGWKVVRRSGSSIGIGQGYTLEAIKEPYQVTISAGQALVVKVLEIRVTIAEESAPEEGISESTEDLKKVMAKLPVPAGAGKMGENAETDYLEVTYQYGGELKEAADWIESQLKEQGWKVTKKEITRMAGIEGGELQATWKNYRLEVSLAHAILLKTITYRLYPLK